MGIVLGMILLEISMADYEFRDFHLIVSAIFALGFTITSFYLEINIYKEAGGSEDMEQQEQTLDRKFVTYSIATYVFGYTLSWLLFSALFMLAGIPVNGLDIHILSIFSTVIYFWLQYKKEEEEYEAMLIEEEIRKEKDKK